jgi:predicted GH43/DUF377 family glycosyl hydrolase
MTALQELARRHGVSHIVENVRSAPFIHRHPGNPVLTAAQLPYPSSLVFNCSVIKERGRYLMLFRNDCFPQHGVDFDPRRGKNGWEEKWQKRYHAGVAPADLEDPTRLIGLAREPLLTPEAPYEVEGGYRNNVIFPMAGIVEDDGLVRIYYGAADTHVCLAIAPV